MTPQIASTRISTSRCFLFRSSRTSSISSKYSTSVVSGDCIAERLLWLQNSINLPILPQKSTKSVRYMLEFICDCPGAIREKWLQLGGTNGYLGLPLDNEHTTP